MKEFTTAGYNMKIAARDGEIEVMKLLLETGVFISEEVMEVAALNGQIEVMKLLHEWNAPISPDAIHEAASSEHIEAMELLYSWNAPIREFDSLNELTWQDDALRLLIKMKKERKIMERKGSIVEEFNIMEARKHFLKGFLEALMERIENTELDQETFIFLDKIFHKAVNKLSKTTEEGE